MFLTRERSFRCLPLAFFAAYALFVAYGLAGAHWRGLDDKDEEQYHLPTVESFAREGVAATLPNYQSATAPLWHIALSKAYQATEGSLLLTRLVNASAGLALVLLLYRLGGDKGALRLLLPACFALSIYVYGPSVRLSTDNIALLGVLGVLTLTAREPSGRRLVAAAAIVGCACLIRQNYLWLWGFLAAWAFYHAAKGTRFGKAAWGSAAIVALASLASLAWLFRLWGGLNPPGFRFHAPEGFRLCYAGCLYLLACLGFFGTFLKPAWLLRGPLRKALLEAGAALCFVALLHAAHAHYGASHRIAGILVFLGETGPRLAGIPVLIGFLAFFGAWFLLAYLRDSSDWNRWQFLLLTGGFIAMAAMNLAAYQKYYEPMTIVLVILSRLPQSASDAVPGIRSACIGAALLLVFQLGALHSKFVF